jgi:regulator of sigma E protease
VFLFITSFKSVLLRGFDKEDYSYMSPFIVKASQLLLSLSLLIVLHELGHFIPAKLFKTRVEKFFLFFDVKFALFKKKIGETVYGIGWLPLGGYVKISGMIDESMDTEAMKEEPKPWEFRSKPAWQRLIIMLGGVTVNFILAIIIYIGLAYAYGEQYMPMKSLKDGVWVTNQEMGNIIGVETGDKILAVDGEEVVNYNDLAAQIVNGYSLTIERDGEVINKEMPVDFIAQLIENKGDGFFLYPRIPFVIAEVPKDSHNVKAGFQPKDIVTAINGKPIAYHDEVIELANANKGKQIEVSVKRYDGSTATFPVTISKEGKLGMITGITLGDLEKMGALTLQTKKYSFLESIPAGFKKGNKILGNYIQQMKKIFNPKTGAYKGVGGFAAIGNLFPAEWDWVDFWQTTAFISLILAFMNILPIPALDGGHVMFLLYEMIAGRKPSDKFMEYAQMAGFFILIALLLFANGNDIYRLLFNG